MNLRRTLAFTKRVLKQLRHDRRTFAFTVGMPLIMIIVFGYTFGGDVSNVNVVVIDLDESSHILVPNENGTGFTAIEVYIGRSIDDSLDKDTLNIKRMKDLDKAKEKVTRSQFSDKTWAAIYFPKEFSSTFTEYLQKQVLAKNLTNQVDCEARGLFWYENRCNVFDRSEAPDHFKKESCENDGFEWYNNRCHEAFRDKAIWTQTECGAHGYFWYDERCHDGADLTIVVDGSNPNIVMAIYVTVFEAMQKAQKDLLDENPDLRRFEIIMPINHVDEYAFGNGDLEFIDSFAPAIMAFAMMMVTTMITIFIFIEERKMGTLERLLASPATEADIVVGYAIAFSIVSLLQAVVILVTAIGLFNIFIAEPVLYGLFVAFVFLILLGVGHQCLGIMLSSGAKNELQAVQFIPIIIYPSILLCGLFWPIESIPDFLRPLSFVVPLTYAIDAVRGAMLRGLGFESLVCHGSALIFFMIVTLLGAIIFLKRRK